MRSKLLILILIISAILRLYKFSSYPVSLSWDEAAIGYNAYSIAQTGYDEYHQKLPLLFRSFDDFKLPGYIYLDAVLVKAFGLSEFTVRLPSAIFGIASVLIIYLLTAQLLGRKVGLASALLLAISPWHIQFSRAAFEANLSLTIVLLGVLLLILGIKNRLYAFISFPFLVTSIYFYYSARLFVPIIILIFLTIYFQKLKFLKYYLIGGLFAILLILPIGRDFLSPHGFKRIKEVSILGNNSLIETYVEARTTTTKIFSPFLDRRIPVLFAAGANYAKHFSPGFLFFTEDPNPRHHSSYTGNLYLIEILTLSLGLMVLLKQQKSVKFLILSWLFLGPLPAAFTQETPHSLRSLLMLPPLVIISALGLSEIFKRKNLRPIFIVIIGFFVLNYLVVYYFIYPLRDNKSWAYGYRQLFQELAKYDPSYDRIVVTGSYWKPYIFYLFYNKVDPRTYIGPTQTIGKYFFGTTSWDGGRDFNQEDINKLASNNTLLALSPSEYSLIEGNGLNKIDEIKDYSGRQTLFVIATKSKPVDGL